MEFFAKNGKIYMNYQEVSIRGINWFGTELDNYALHGLWAENLDHFINTLKTNNFNALRITMSAEIMLNLDSYKVKYVDQTQNPGMQDVTAGTLLNTVIRKCYDAGILVLPNMHRHKAGGEISELWYSDEYPESRVIEAWQTLVRRYKNYPNLFAVDLKNEPHGSATWGSNDKRTDWAQACERIGNAILGVNPKLLIFAASITSQIWGDNADPAQKRPLKLKVADKIVYTPHAYKHWNYPNSQSFNNTTYWDACFGNLAKTKKCAVVLGEWGYSHNDATDNQWANDLVNYMNAHGLTNAFYWAFNSNASGDQYLLENDWKTIVSSKMELIKKMTPKPTSFNFKVKGTVKL